jgi:hypothetical protein
MTSAFAHLGTIRTADAGLHVPGPHTILIQLVNPNHEPVDQDVVRVTVPKRGP